MLDLYKNRLLMNSLLTMDFIDEKRPYGATVNNGGSRIKTTRKFKKIFRISEEFQNNHWKVL